MTDELFAVPFGGMTTGEFAAWNRDWLKRWKHPKFDVGVEGLIYQPLIESIRYLEDNWFTAYIFTADEGDFLRLVSEQLYGLGPERVYGSRVGTDFVAEAGKAGLLAPTWAEYFDNWAGKPRLIEAVIGRRPVLGAGTVWWTRRDSDRRFFHHTTGNKEAPSWPSTARYRGIGFVVQQR